jgi:hypothetical protein
MADQIVPLTSSSNQSFKAVLNVNGGVLLLNLTFKYNEMAQYWVMTIQDTDNNYLVDSIPLVTGTWPAANLLKQYQHLMIGSCYVINASSTPLYDYPSQFNLGNDFVLVWGDNV